MCSLGTDKCYPAQLGCGCLSPHWSSHTGCFEVSRAPHVEKAVLYEQTGAWGRYRGALVRMQAGAVAVQLFALRAQHQEKDTGAGRVNICWFVCLVESALDSVNSWKRREQSCRLIIIVVLWILASPELRKTLLKCRGTLAINFPETSRNVAWKCKELKCDSGGVWSRWLRKSVKAYTARSPASGASWRLVVLKCFAHFESLCRISALVFE